MKRTTLPAQSIGVPLLIGLSVGIIILAAYFFFFHIPATEQYGQDQIAHVELEAQRDALRIEASGRDSALLSLNRLCDLRDDRLNRLPLVPDRSSSQFAIEEFARRAGFEEATTSWLPAVTDDSRTAHHLELSARGTYDAAIKFVDLLKLHQHDVYIHRAQFAAPEETEGGQRSARQPESDMAWELVMYSASTSQRNGGQLCDMAQDDSSPSVE